MTSNSYSDLSPGVFVINEKNDDWGIGQIQSSIDDKITIIVESNHLKINKINLIESRKKN